MKFEIRKIVKPICLKDYAPEYGDVQIMTWVNPPMSVRQEFGTNQQEVVALGIKFNALMARIEKMPQHKDPEDKSVIEEFETEIAGISGALSVLNSETVNLLSLLWSQSEDPDDHWSPDEIWELNKTAQETDPQLFGWLKRRTIEMVLEHLQSVKKG